MNRITMVPLLWTWAVASSVWAEPTTIMEIVNDTDATVEFESISSHRRLVGQFTLLPGESRTLERHMLSIPPAEDQQALRERSYLAVRFTKAGEREKRLFFWRADGWVYHTHVAHRKTQVPQFSNRSSSKVPGHSRSGGSRKLHFRSFIDGRISWQVMRK